MYLYVTWLYVWSDTVSFNYMYFYMYFSIQLPTESIQLRHDLIVR